MWGTVDGINPAITTCDVKKHLVNHGIHYQPEVVQDFFHQQYENSLFGIQCLLNDDNWRVKRLQNIF